MCYFEKTNDLSMINASLNLASWGADNLQVKMSLLDGNNCLIYYMNGPNEAEHYTFELIFYDIVHMNMPWDFEMSCCSSIKQMPYEIIQPFLEPYFYEHMREEFFDEKNMFGYKAFCLVDEKGTFLNNFVLSRSLTGKWI